MAKRPRHNRLYPRHGYLDPPLLWASRGLRGGRREATFGAGDHGHQQDEADVYLRLTTAVKMLSGLQIVTYSVPAIERFGRLLAMKLNVGEKDLRIAAITLEVGAVVVTRNERDFRRVPGLVVENWAS